MNRYWLITAGIAAGILSGLLGTGGGIALILLLPHIPGFSKENLFPSCVCIMLPICIVGAVICWMNGSMISDNLLTYLAGSTVGGIVAGVWGHKIPLSWLHKCFGTLVLLGGIRLLWLV